MLLWQQRWHEEEDKTTLHYDFDDKMVEQVHLGGQEAAAAQEHNNGREARRRLARIPISKDTLCNIISPLYPERRRGIGKGAGADTDTLVNILC